MIFHNFTYDDGKESEFIYNYEHVSALEPSKLLIITSLLKFVLFIMCLLQYTLQ